MRINSFLTKGDTKTIRNAVTTDDASNEPSVGSGQDFSNYIYVILKITIAGTDTPTAQITPLICDDATNYEEGIGETITGAGVYRRYVEVAGTPDFNTTIDNISGTDTTVTVEATGLNK